MKYVNIGVRSFLILRKGNITQKNYLIIFERVDKLSTKNMYLRKILDLDYVIFYWICIGNVADRDL